MKKILGALVCMLTLVGGAMEAEASYIADWTYSLDAVKFNGATSLSKPGSLYNHEFKQNIDTTNTGNITLNGPIAGGGSVIPTSNAFLDATTTPAATAPSNDPVHIVDYMTVTFEYSATAFDPIANKEVRISALYTVPFQYHYDGNGNEYIFYKSSPLEANVTPNLQAHGYEDGEYKYSLGEVHLFVDGNPLVGIGADNPLIPDEEEGVYVGWVINEETRAQYWDDNNLLTKTELGLFNIGGNFHLNYSKVDNGPAPTPEPATMLLTGLGLAGLGWAKRRRGQ